MRLAERVAKAGETRADPRGVPGESRPKSTYRKGAACRPPTRRATAQSDEVPPVAEVGAALASS